MKEIKKICKTSNDCLDHVYHLVMSQLNQEHSEIRLSALQITNELFLRSHHFRTLVVDNLQETLELTVETDSEQPLPPPKEVARKLRALAIQTVQSWHSLYGGAYKKLALGYHFLKKIKKVDFQDVEARTVVERRRDEERQRKREAMYKEKVEAASKDMEDSYPEIQAALTEMESCMKLLSPEFDLTDVESCPAARECPPADEQPCCSRDLLDDGKESMKREGQEEETSTEDSEVEDDSFIQSSGLVSYSYSLDLDISRDLYIKETEDNEAVVSTLIDLHRLLTFKHLPAVQGWIQVFTKSGAEQQLMARALDLKRSLEAACVKLPHLICLAGRQHSMLSGLNEVSYQWPDFIKVPEKEGYEPHIPEHLRAEYGNIEKKRVLFAFLNGPSWCQVQNRQRLKRLLEEEQDPTCAAATWRVQQLSEQSHSSSAPSSSQSSSSKKSKIENIPVVPFGLDLYYWGKEHPNSGKIFKLPSQHQFWAHAPMEEEVENAELLAESKSRCISFPGSFTPVSHFCRARLDNGLLCQRQDRLKCPFHGRIIPRDDVGLPINEEDRLREEQEARRKRDEETDWRDAELMRDIEAATGENLGSDRVSKKGKGKKKKYPNLSDLKQSSSTSRSRLEKKVFNKSSMRRVAQVMKKADSKKHDKFSNQFNYALH
uniref:UV-stimulated scaffold protein A n=1 Tax=Tetraodon nigroviridis TaxID=99883 RepID=H3CLH8_TETNG